MGENGRLVHPATGPLEPEPAPRPGQPAVDQSQFRTVMSRFATGVTVVTTLSRGIDHAMTANAFTSVSLAPPIVSVNIVDFFLSLAIWGATTTVRIAG